MSDNQWQPIIRRLEHPNIQRNVLIHKRSFANWQTIREQHSGNYYMTSVVRALYALAINPGGNLGATQTQCFGPLRFFYTIEDTGDIKVQMLHIEEYKTAGAQTPGIYQVAWANLDGWKTDQKHLSSMDISHRWADAHSAAVVGKFNNKEDAGEKIIIHITKAYAAAFSQKEIEKEGNHFSLFWLNNEFKDKKHVLSLVSLIQNAQKQSAKVRWLIQGEGVGVFVQALQFILDNPTSSSILTAQKGLENQMVFFSNPRGKDTSEKALKAICEKAGLTYIGTSVNFKDVLGNDDARLAAQTEIANLVAKFSIGGLSGAAGYSALENTWNLTTSTSNTLAAIGFGVSGYMIGKSAVAKLWGYAKNLPGAVHSTFGSGNQHWSK